ncbi:MAG: hypothetical protein V3U74_06610 [Thermodesulfobacteriota bacterium]
MLNVLDYIRVRAISEWSGVGLEQLGVTYAIECAPDSRFRSPKRGVLTINIADFLPPEDRSEEVLRNAANRLVGKVFMRVKKENSEIYICHIHGLPLGDWLAREINFLGA